MLLPVLILANCTATGVGTRKIAKAQALFKEPVKPKMLTVVL